MQIVKLTDKEMKIIYHDEVYLLSHHQCILCMADDQKNVNFNIGDVTWYIVHRVAPICHQIAKKC